MNWGKGHICGAHWSKPRENATHLPDIIVPDDQYGKICEKHTLAKQTFESYKNPNDKLKLRYKTAKRRFEVATEIKNTVPEKQRNPIERDVSVLIVLKRRELSKKQYKIRLNSALSEMNDLKKELQEANDKIKQLQNEVHIKNMELSKIKTKNVIDNKCIIHLKNKIATSNQKDFKHANLVDQPKLFHYLCGLSVEQFKIIFNCVAPYTHLLPYPDCDVSTPICRSTDAATELLSVLTICRHGLNQGVMAFMIDKSKSTMQRIFIGWVIFLATIFNEIDLTPASGFLLKNAKKFYRNRARFNRHCNRCNRV